MKNYKKYALVSVYDKKYLSSLCNVLKKYNIGIISTGSTANEILKLNYDCELVSDLTKFKEILDGRVKTLHPKIHASLLFKRKNNKHYKTFKKLKFPIIDFVFVNLYPFQEVIKKTKEIDKCIEMIDIGGPALLRSSAKNYHSVTSVCNINDYKNFINQMNFNRGYTSIQFRKKMAIKVFALTAEYDYNINNWFTNNSKKINKNKIIKLKYGENSNQKSTFIIKNLKNSLFKAKIQGKDLGYNNLLDLDSGLNCLKEFNEPTCVVIKHNNPCGVASSKKIENAYNKAISSDPISIFGGIVFFNRSINETLAKKIIKNFYEIIVAPSYNKKALNILNKKKKLILIETKKINVENKVEIKSIVGGYLKQEKNLTKISNQNIKCVTDYKTSTKQLKDLIFAFKVCKHVKSNAIVLAYNQQTIGIGAGQMSRIDATKIAISKVKKVKKKLSYVAASDAFFPFTDSIKDLYKNNCCAIIQPMGSINDNKIINFANKKKLPIYFSKYRLFKH